MFFFLTHKIRKCSARTTTKNDHRHHFYFVHFEELPEPEGHNWHEEKLNEGSNCGANGLFCEFENLARFHRYPKSEHEEDDCQGDQDHGGQKVVVKVAENLASKIISLKLCLSFLTQRQW